METKYLPLKGRTFGSLVNAFAVPFFLPEDGVIVRIVGFVDRLMWGASPACWTGAVDGSNVASVV